MRCGPVQFFLAEILQMNEVHPLRATGQYFRPNSFDLPVRFDCNWPLASDSRLSNSIPRRMPPHLEAADKVSDLEMEIGGGTHRCDLFPFDWTVSGDYDVVIDFTDGTGH